MIKMKFKLETYLKIPHPEIIDTINKLSHLDDKEKTKSSVYTYESYKSNIKT